MFKILRSINKLIHKYVCKDCNRKLHTTKIGSTSRAIKECKCKQVKA